MLYLFCAIALTVLLNKFCVLTRFSHEPAQNSTSTRRHFASFGLGYVVASHCDLPMPDVVIASVGIFLPDINISLIVFARSSDSF